jgi:hypothetical protein
LNSGCCHNSRRCRLFSFDYFIALEQASAKGNIAWQNPKTERASDIVGILAQARRALLD